MSSRASSRFFLVSFDGIILRALGYGARRPFKILPAGLPADDDRHFAPDGLTRLMPGRTKTKKVTSGARTSLEGLN